MAMTTEPNEHYYQLASYNLAAAIALPILDVIAVILRIYARKKQNLPLKLDDWLTIPALSKGITKHSVGYLTPPSQHVSSRTELTTLNPAIVVTSQVEWTMYVICIPALGLIKLSILSFYHRIFCPQKTGIARFIITGMMCIIGLWTLGFWFAHVFICKGYFSAYWGSTDDLKAKCLNTLLKTYSLSISDFITDVLTLIIPLPLLWKLQLQTSKKIAVTLIFLLGAIAVAASALRLVFVSQAVNEGFNPRDDEDLTITGLLYWLLVEVCLGLLAACLPTIRFLFKGLSPDSVINSIRSAFSLHSFRSNRSRLYDDTTNPQTGENASNASNTHIVGSKETTENSSSGFPAETIGKRKVSENV
ncbi:hypothetical protein G7Y89_g13188 [Cudoniella acicularis]|uniref:Rhodopsin domain-containing protein n=1 Tax=Cudoniella acicularis TaxID=354080 RepID=A0A8H4RB73_9HELO|nr:hypothetical protein G7Y89_g13188 [Cudoniella acicularis]